MASAPGGPSDALILERLRPDADGIQGTPAYVIGDELIPGAVQLADLQAVVAKARKVAGTD